MSRKLSAAVGCGALFVFGFACSSDPPAGEGASGSGGQGGSRAAGNGGTGGTAAGKSGAGGSSGSGGSSGGSAGTTASGGSAGSSAAGGTVGGTAGSASGSGGSAGSTAGDGGLGGAGSGGSAGSSAGESGSAGTSAGASGSGAGGYNGTVIVSDSFDAQANGGDPDATKWLAYGEFEAGGPVIDTARAHSAPNAARVTPSMGGGLGSFLVPASGLPAPNNRFYVRVWMNWEKASSAVTGHGGFLVGASSRDNSGTEMRLGISNPGFAPILDANLQNPSDGGGGEVTRFSNGYTTGGNPGAFPQMGFQFEANRWYCVEAFFNGGGHEFRVWVDEVEVTEMHITDFTGNNTPRTMWSPTYSVLKIGGQDYGSSLGSIWYDDILVGTEPVGCDL